MKKRIVIAFSVIFLIFAAWILRHESNDTRTSLQKLPTAEEMQTWDMSEIDKLKVQIEQIPLDSSEEYFTNEVKALLKEYEHVELGAVTIEKDSLSVIKGQNHKSLYNLILKIDVVIDTGKQENSFELAKQLTEEIPEYLEQYSYIRLKVKGIDINVLDLNQGKLCNTETSYSVMNETAFAEQPEDEYAVQTLAFQYQEINPDLSLRKFGVVPETQELYVGYSVQDACFESGREKETITNLETISEDVREYLLSQKITEEFAAANQVKQLTVSFFNGSLENDLRFTFEIH